MNSLCTHCGRRVESTWSFCAHCGATVSHATESALDHNPEPAPVKGVFGGMFFGFVAVPLLLVVGSLLCLTGLGAFLGVPMIIAGIVAPLAGLVFGMSGDTKGGLFTYRNKSGKAA